MLWFLFLFTQTLFMTFLYCQSKERERERDGSVTGYKRKEESWANTALGNISLLHTGCNADDDKEQQQEH